MTLVHANIIADRIESQPELYSTPPDFSAGVDHFTGTSYGGQYPWLLMRNPAGNPTSPYQNLYYSFGGFSRSYSQVISDWKETPLTGNGGRYITVDDMRMLPYVGIEYSRAKLKGWRYRYGDCGEDGAYFPPGCIVRDADGARWIHAIGYVNPPPHASQSAAENFNSRRTWTRMMQAPNFSALEGGSFDYPDTFEIPEGEFTGIVQLGTLEGKNDLVKFYIDRDTADFAVAGDVWQASVESGGLEIIVTANSTVDLDTFGTYPVVYQQNSIPVYYAWNNKKAYDSGKAPRILDTDPYDVYDWYYTLSDIACRGSFVPLSKGVTYNVIARFSSAVLRKYDGKPLVSFQRRTANTRAPAFKYTENTRVYVNN